MAEFTHTHTHTHTQSDGNQLRMDDHTLINMFGALRLNRCRIDDPHKNKPVRQVKRVPAHLSLITWSDRHVAFCHATHLTDSVSVSLQALTWRTSVHVDEDRNRNRSCFFAFSVLTSSQDVKENPSFFTRTAADGESLAEMLVNVDLLLRVSSITGGQNHGCKSQTASKSRD